jgi:hypothetical protein
MLGTNSEILEEKEEECQQHQQEEQQEETQLSQCHLRSAHVPLGQRTC